jgi:hypothetical protein
MRIEFVDASMAYKRNIKFRRNRIVHHHKEPPFVNLLKSFSEYADVQQIATGEEGTGTSGKINVPFAKA